ncbi:MAG: phosphate ABC transporter substrate-binding protein PstS [Pyrinomonadaceae bacterium]
MIINKLIVKVTFFLLLCAVAIGISCSGQKMGSEGGGSSTGSGGVQIQGSGSTFVKPMMDKWTSEFGKLNPTVKIDYQSTGSGAGIKAIQNRTSDFGATDAAMTDDELKQAPGEIVHIPVVLGAVVITYNLEGVTQPLRLSPEVVSDIYLGKIKKWNDDKIKKENADAQLPDATITPVFRADGSGTSDVFTDYLSKTVPEWKEKIGRTKNPQLPEGVGIGAKGNEGVMGQVKNTPNTIGYVELTFAKANKLPTALIKNSSDNFVEPNGESVSAAAAEIAAKIPDDLRTQFTNASGATAYPISGIVYVLAYKDQADEARGKALAEFLWWATHDGTKFVADLHYAPLPAGLVTKVEGKIKSLTSGGKPLKQ